MRQGTESPQSTEGGTRRWANLAGLLAGGSAVGGLLLHLIGITANQTYFQQWGLDAAMFPKAVDVTLVLGYYALFDGVTKIFVGLVIKYWLWLLAYGLVLGIAASLATPTRHTPPRRLLARWAVRHERLTTAAITMAVGVGVAAVFLPFALATVLFLLLLPLSAGDQYGKVMVQEQLNDFKGGCDNLASKAKCTSLLRADRVIDRGFLIAAGDAHVVVYDPSTNHVLVHERAGLTLRGAPNWLAYPPDWKASDIQQGP